MGWNNPTQNREENPASASKEYAENNVYSRNRWRTLSRLQDNGQMTMEWVNSEIVTINQINATSMIPLDKKFLKHKAKHSFCMGG